MKKGAFSILELLLVIAIMGVLMVAGTSWVNQKTTTFKINQTKQQIQRIAEAALAYYADYSQWPKQNDNTFLTQYLEQMALKNPWGKDYALNGPGNFIITTNVTNANIANRIAALLPATSGDASGNVTMQISRLPTKKQGDLITIKDVVEVQCGGSIKVSSKCSANQKPCFLVGVNGVNFTFDKNKNKKLPINFRAKFSGCVSGSCTIDCFFTNSAADGVTSDGLRVEYVSLCVDNSLKCPTGQS